MFENIYCFKYEELKNKDSVSVCQCIITIAFGPDLCATYDKTRIKNLFFLFFLVKKQMYVFLRVSSIKHTYKFKQIDIHKQKITFGLYGLSLI